MGPPAVALVTLHAQNPPLPIRDELERGAVTPPSNPVAPAYGPATLFLTPNRKLPWHF